ncbi:MAG: transglutaminase family protein [Sneathiella sp.]
MIDVMGQSSNQVPADWVNATSYIDYEAPSVQAFLTKVLLEKETLSDTEKAICLFNAVRDDIRYDPYQIGFDSAEYVASYIADLPAAFCVPKAILLTACLRAIGIPAGVGFADVKNHLNSPKLAEKMGTDLFVYHGYVALELDGAVYKVTPTFNQELCDRFGVKVIEFDGKSDALFHEFDADENKHMEYVKDRGIFQNPPMAHILKDLEEIYPKLKAMKNQTTKIVEDPQFAA